MCTELYLLYQGKGKYMPYNSKRFQKKILLDLFNLSYGKNPVVPHSKMASVNIASVFWA